MLERLSILTHENKILQSRNKMCRKFLPYEESPYKGAEEFSCSPGSGMWCWTSITVLERIGVYLVQRQKHNLAIKCSCLQQLTRCDRKMLGTNLCQLFICMEKNALLTPVQVTCFLHFSPNHGSVKSHKTFFIFSLLFLFLLH